MDVAAKISARNQELEIRQHASDAAADFALTIRHDIVVLACIRLEEQAPAVAPGKTRLAPVVSGLFSRDFLHQSVEIIKQKTVDTESTPVTLIAYPRGAYARAIDIPTLEAAFGKAIANQICGELRKRAGRVPVLFASQRAFYGIETVPAASRSRVR